MTTTPQADTSTFLGDDPEVDRLYDNVQAEVQGAGLTLVKMHAWNAIEEFYVRSTSRRETAYWSMPAGVTEVSFNPFSADWLACWMLEVHGLHRFRIDQHTASLHDLTCPAPQTQRNGSVLLALKPTSFGAELSPLLWMQWFDTILSGTLHRLYRIPQRPWTNAQLAQFHGRQYMAGITRARAIADKEWTDGGGRWRFPYFANGRRKN